MIMYTVHHASLKQPVDVFVMVSAGETFAGQLKAIFPRLAPSTFLVVGGPRRA